MISSINFQDHVDDVDQVLREMTRVLAPGGMILLMVEIHPRPTIAEPHALPWDLTTRFGGLQVVEQLHLAKPADGTGYSGAHLPFDHDRAATGSDRQAREGSLEGARPLRGMGTGAPAARPKSDRRKVK